MNVGGENSEAVRRRVSPAPEGAPPLGQSLDIFGQMAGLPPLCRPAGWVAMWRRLARIGARDGRLAG